MRDSPNIPMEQLQACLKNHYRIRLEELAYLPLGLDYSAAVYRVKSEQGASYLLKATSSPLYEPSYLVPCFLREQGITSVVAPIPTVGGQLWTKLNDETVVLYPYIEGKSSFDGMKDEQWSKLGSALKLIHEAPSPARIQSLRTESFDTTEYARGLHTLDTLRIAPKSRAASASLLLSSWAEHRSLIFTLFDAMHRLSELLKLRPMPFVICHADLHPANVIRDPAGNVHVIDWSEVMLAPKERDFIFVRHPHADAFFRTYTPASIDGQALTYYRLERIVQDLIECGRNVCLRSDLGDESKQAELKLFQDILQDTPYLMDLLQAGDPS